MDRFDPFVKYADVYGDIINWEKDPMNKPQNQNKYFFSDGKTYYEQICKMLRLMSVFKEAFNQIYSNEDEISEAWENFVNNLSASVVEGSEPDVTLTWTDDSVNFEFTMVPGVPGEQGVGITSISFNSDYTMTITLSDGNTYTSMSLKGETGPQGPQGETGSGLQILDVYATLADLQSAHPTGQPGDAYQVGSAGNYTLYIWSSSQSAWVQAGTLGTVSPSTSSPLMNGTASAGSSDLYSRGDHVHPSDTSRASKEEIDELIKTSRTLIDQSFTYRESPAIQDGLARIDKIKGNTLKWNQFCCKGRYFTRGNNEWQNTFTENGVTFTYLDDYTVRIAGTPTARTYIYLNRMDDSANYPVKQGEKLLLRCSDIPDGIDIFSSLYLDNKWKGTGPQKSNKYFTVPSDVNKLICIGIDVLALLVGQTIDITVSLNIFNLTKMFGSGNEPTEEEFNALFPIYYPYNSGSLIPFNGNGIKTVGKNRINIDDVQIGKAWNGAPNTARAVVYAPCFPRTQYTLSFGTLNVDDILLVEKITEDATTTKRLVSVKASNPFTFRTNEESHVFGFQFNKANISASDLDGLNLQIEFGSSASSYEPYTSSTLSLPISTYFPNGMKSRGNVYDELTPRKAITRVGSRAYQSGDESDTSVITDGTNTYYVLETPIERNIDIDLSFNSYENGTEQLLPVNGSVPATSPIIADMTYLSIDDAMEYIIDKLANVPLNTQQILDALEDDVADLQTDVGALQPAVSAIQTSVGNINTNIGQLSSTVAGHTASISGMQSDISDMDNSITSLEGTIANHTSRIGTLESGLSTTNGNVQSLSSHVQSIDGRVTNLETDLLIVVKKEYDYDSVAGNTDFGVQTPLSQEPGYKIIGIVGSEVQQGEYTSAEPWIIVTQAHVHYTSTGGVVLSMMARNVSQYTKTNVRVYLYLLCIKDIQPQ